MGDNDTEPRYVFQTMGVWLLPRLRWEASRRLRQGWRPVDYPTRSSTLRFEVNAWEIGLFVSTRLVPRVGVHPFPPNELMLMVGALLWTEPDVVIEWGTNIGISARVFHETKQRFGLGPPIHSIDLPADQGHAEHPGKRRGLLVRRKDVHLHLGDGAETACRILTAEAYQCPLVFIDGDHRKDSVMRDITTVLETAPRAHVLIHDTFFQPGSSYNHGPHEAVSEVRTGIASGFETVFQEVGRPGMTFLYPPGSEGPSKADKRALMSDR